MLSEEKLGKEIADYTAKHGRDPESHFFFRVENMIYTCSMREIGSLNDWLIKTYPNIFMSYIGKQTENILIMNVNVGNESSFYDLLIDLGWEKIYEYSGNAGWVTTFIYNNR